MVQTVNSVCLIATEPTDEEFCVSLLFVVWFFVFFLSEVLTHLSETSAL